jgi:hypothetical protein
MHPTAGALAIVLGGALASLTVGWLRSTLSPVAVDVLMALAGAVIGVGGLLMTDDVSAASWIAGPLALAVIAPLNVRALFARGGPFRT